MRALSHKLVRDLWHMRGQAFAIMALVICATAALVGFHGTGRSLAHSRDLYYGRYHFSDLFAPVERAPERVVADLALVPGVAEVDTRIVTEVPAELEGYEEPIAARLVSLPEDGVPRQNRLYVRVGRLIGPGAPNEAVVSEAFARAHGLTPGRHVTVVIEGHRQRLDIVGIALSPEYIYQIRGGELMPDDKHFGVVWMGREALAAALSLEGAFNEATIRLTHDGSQRAVIASIDRLLAAHGGLGAYGHEHHISDRFVSQEIEQLRLMAVAVPAIFLAVAAFLINMVLARVIATEREQIATLKALGYSSRSVAAHYLELVALIVGAALCAGTLFGFYLGRAMTEMYTTSYFRLPLFVYEPEMRVVLLAAAASFGAAFVAVLASVRRAVALPPAAAMRPEPPATFQKTLIERWGLAHLFSQPGRMVLRNLGRRPWRALLSSVGIATAVAVLVVGAFIKDALDFMIDFQFEQTQRDDVAVTFTRPLSDEALLELARMPGVLRVEPYRAVPVTLSAGHRSYRTALTAEADKAELRRIIDTARGAVHPSASGITMSRTLADILHVAPGDPIRVDVLENRRQSFVLPLAGTVDELVGVGAYVRMDTLHALLDEAPAASGAYLATDAASDRGLYKALRTLPAVAGVTLRRGALESFRVSLAEYLLVFAFGLVLFALVIAVGVVYNAARIALAERQRELATLRVLGFTRREVTIILLGELGAQLLLALPIGCVLGFILAAVTATGMDTELFRIPLVIAPSTYALASLIVVAASLAVALALTRRLAHLDLLEVLKTKE